MLYRHVQMSSVKSVQQEPSTDQEHTQSGETSVGKMEVNSYRDISTLYIYITPHLYK